MRQAKRKPLATKAATLPSPDAMVAPGRSTADTWWVLLFALMTALAFSSTITAPWEFDDHPSIRLNPTI